MLRILPFILCLIIPVFGAFENLKSLEGDFIQTIVTSEGEQVSYKGYLYMKKPHFVRWNYIEPTPKELFSDGKKALIYEPLLEQVTLLNINQKMLNFSTLLSKAKKGEDGKFYANIENTEYVVSVDKKGIPMLIAYQDEFENKINIIIQNYKSNHNIPNNTFTFTPPKGVDLDVIKQQ
ncbi:hypothetical protein CCZ01_08645 [Helicobacter monodelphidis]|uniref:LolA-like outer membrane lipoprotein chaperone n=1 Tax=Helicobacter sp. 15-1451 TaxID=2004995 RepID=UPI000DCBF198|nr:LolA-like outer membrane lipoprotein chaperone [Helicobacter sp. 15-1451]RAX56704.1 hypothetical protein CCZ01_08645 [Helicobacter sp. 15-1451]